MNVIQTITLPELGEKHSGKVRDYYIVGDKRILITTDRISAFDRNLGYIPYKGQVLNQLSAFWFEKTQTIITNHVIAIPDPNITIAHNATPIPIEMVVRGSITGVTGTSIWGSYARGERVIYGIRFPDGLRKNDKLPHPVITPTTKPEVGHDERLTREEILEKKIVSPELYKQMEEVSLKLFALGTHICEQAGLILADTKYEFGLYQGKLMLIDEIHTPDSSRFWVKKTYQERIAKGEEPENFDKEFLRLWFAKHGYTGEGEPPTMPTVFIKQVSQRYIDCFEKITGESFQKAAMASVLSRIRENLAMAGMLPTEKHATMKIRTNKTS
jgi:phosphoribosylaminoimidazole-succinocarboxamide synthase